MVCRGRGALLALTCRADRGTKKGAPGATRTRDTQLRRLVLYPSELQGRATPNLTFSSLAECRHHLSALLWLSLVSCRRSVGLML